MTPGTGRAQIGSVHVRLPSRRSIVLQTFPSCDRDFAAAVAEALVDVRRSTNDPEELRLGVTERLRASYRNVRLVWQEPLGSVVPRQATLYAFRDAAIRPASAERERLYGLLAAARRTVNASREVVERSQRIAGKAGHHDGGAVASGDLAVDCLLYTSPSPRDLSTSRMPSSA